MEGQPTASVENDRRFKARQCSSTGSETVPFGDGLAAVPLSDVWSSRRRDHGVTLCHMSDHFTLRLPSGTTARIRRRADRSGSAPRTLAQRYVEEGLRHDDHPLVHFLAGASGRRATLIGTGLEVWEVIATVRDNHDDPGAAADYLEISPGLVEAALLYYGEYGEEIDREIVQNEEEWERGYAAWQAAQRALRP